MKPTTILTTCVSLSVLLTGCDKPPGRLKDPDQDAVATEPGRDPAIASRIRKEIGAILGKAPDSIKNSDAFIKDLDADSLDTVEIVMAIEEAFDISIEDEAAVKLITVGDLIDYVCIRIKTAPGSLRKISTPETETVETQARKCLESSDRF